MKKQAMLIRSYRNQIINAVMNWQKENYPDRTNRYDKCERDLRYVFKAYCSDIYTNSTNSIENISSKYWFNNKRQIIEYKTELAVHKFMVDYIIKEILQEEEDFKDCTEHLKKLYDILEDTIVFGPKYTSFTHLNYYKYVYQYDELEDVDHNLIEQALYDAWKNTPSKNNFMPYQVHVIRPEDIAIKELIYYKCLENETKANGNHITDLEGLKKYEQDEYGSDNRPNYYNVKSAHYILIFTQRVETIPNQHQQDLIDRGFVYEQMAKNGPKKDSAKSVAYLEIGMFCSNFANACLASGIDISHTLCFPSDKKYWSEPEFSFLDMNPLLIMTAGKAIKYRRDSIPLYLDPKPDFERIVNIVDKK